MARPKSAAADLGAWLCFEDEAGQGLRPPKGRTWGRRGITPVVKATAAGTKRVSVAGLVCTRPGDPPRLFWRTHVNRGPAKGRRKGFAEAGYARLLDAAHRRLGTPIVAVWDNLNTHTNARMRQLAAARDWLSIAQLPAYAPEFNPVEAVWSHLKRSLANLAKCGIDPLAAMVRARLRRIQRRTDLLAGFIAKTGLDFTPITPAVKPL